MGKIAYRAWIPVLLLAMAWSAPAQEWYFSNAAGMILEPALSRLAALRSKYCLEVGTLPARDLPEYLQQYHDPAYRIELHILYERGKESRRQWVFKDEKGTTRLVSSLNPVVKKNAPQSGTPQKDAPPAAAGPSADEPPSSPIGFIEIYDENHLITEEHQFSQDSPESIIAYFYNNQVLIRVETRLKAAGTELSGTESSETESSSTESSGTAAADGPVITTVTTDYYRYTRSNSLRSVERVYHQAVSEEGRLTRLQFPSLGLHVRVDENFVSPGTAYSSDFLQDVLSGSDNIPGDRVVYTTDERGKVLTETRRDAEGNVLGEIHNTWSGDRLVSVSWQSGEDERRTEYEYDQAGDRIIERDYNKGTLERRVLREQGRETEELYMNGEVILRATWENGRKISEERVRSPRQ
ncbi:MAG: hypothetical protein LBT14_08205 [Treponema sp.]|nr:hypothetical protein [Treponema sp.]